MPLPWIFQAPLKSVGKAISMKTQALHWIEKRRRKRCKSNNTFCTISFKLHEVTFDVFHFQPEKILDTKLTFFQYLAQNIESRDSYKMYFGKEIDKNAGLKQ